MSDEPYRGRYADYSPGGLTATAKRKRWARINGRKGGIASGRRRRQLAPGCRAPRHRTRDAALALVFPHRQPTRREFAAAYETAFPRPERPSAALQWARGRETCWVELVCLWRLYRAAGQSARTTNGQRGLALASQGRPRCRRAIQYTHRRLEALGYVKVHWYRNQRDKPGHKDHLVVEIRTRTISLCTPPLRGSRNPPFRREVPTACPKESQEISLCTPQRRNCDLSPPATPADDDQLQCTEREKLEAQLSFLELKQQMGWTSPQLQADLRRVRMELRLQATEGPEDDRSPGTD